MELLLGYDDDSDKELVESPSTNGKSSEQATCIMCRGNPPKYTCPSCNRKTCSLECVRLHKKHYDCTGSAISVDFIAKNAFSEHHFHQDYRFLQEVERTSDNAMRTFFQWKDSRSPSVHPQQNKELMFQLRKRHITLKRMEPGMKRHKINKSSFIPKKGEITWTIEWCIDENVFGKVIRHVASVVMESENVYSAFENMLSKLDALSEDLVVKAKEMRNDSMLKLYFRPIYGMEKVQKLLFLLDWNMTINEALAGKQILEFPIFFVSRLEPPTSEYKIITIEEQQTMLAAKNTSITADGESKVSSSRNVRYKGKRKHSKNRHT